MIEEIKKKIYYVKGKTTEELKALSDDDVLKIIGSRGRRSLKKGLTKAQKDLMIKVEMSNKLVSEGKQQTAIKTHCRNAIIVPKMIGLKIEVHTGRVFEPVVVKPEMIGHYLGEFALTRKKVNHAGAGSGAKGKESVSLK